jgi:hypothetical protein
MNRATKAIAALYYILLLVFFLPISSIAQFYIGSNSKLILNSNVNLVLNNINLQNQGSIYVGNSSFVFAGTSSNNISSSSPMTFQDITINKPNGEFVLNSDIIVTGMVKLTAGNLFLNNKIIHLDSTGYIDGENDTRRIYDTGTGKILVTVVLNNPVVVNPGNIGLELTGSGNLGLTQITRGFKNQVLGNGSTGISRYFSIQPSNSSGFNLSLKAFYFNNELAGNNGIKSFLSLWSSMNAGVSWTNIGKNDMDTVNNWVLKSNINQLGMITIANGGNAALPVNFIRFAGNQLTPGTVKLVWDVSNLSSVSDRFEIERSSDGILFTKIGTQKIDRPNTTEFSMLDFSPNEGKNYYRIRQTDKDNRYILSGTIQVMVNPGISVLKLYPNPVLSKLNINYYSKIACDCIISIYTISGNQVATRKVHFVKGNNSLEWYMGQLSPGVYNIEFNGPVNKVSQLIKQ